MRASRLNRLFHPRSRRCFDVAIDHGFFNELSTCRHPTFKAQPVPVTRLPKTGIPKTGTENFDGAMVTATGLVFCAGAQKRTSPLQTFYGIEDNFWPGSGMRSRLAFG
jgi:DhnA family fructose-bisphosphate aldolase class Ia